VYRLGAGWPGNMGSIPGRGRACSLFHNVCIPSSIDSVQLRAVGVGYEASGIWSLQLISIYNRSKNLVELYLHRFPLPPGASLWRGGKLDTKQLWLFMEGLKEEILRCKTFILRISSCYALRHCYTLQ